MIKKGSSEFQLTAPQKEGDSVVSWVYLIAPNKMNWIVHLLFPHPRGRFLILGSDFLLFIFVPMFYRYIDLMIC